MVFRSDKERKGFFARINQRLEERSQRRQAEQNAELERERQKLSQLRQRQATSLEHRRAVVQQERAVLQQKKEIQDIKAEEKRIKQELFRTSRTGRAISAVQRGAAAAGKAIEQPAPRRRVRKKPRRIPESERSIFDI